MPLTPQDVDRLAGLARIDLTQEELETLAPQLDVILQAVAKVSQIATDDIEPTSHSVQLTNVFRADEVAPSLPIEKVLANAPAVEDDRFRVPQILDEES